MKNRSIEAIISPPAPHMVGDAFRVHGFIPGVPRLNMQRMDPFLVMDYNAKMLVPPSEMPRGVGVHPHRGFETVTIAYKGSVAHHDSHGGGGVIREGDVQWMTAAGGVLHKEYYADDFNKKGGDFQMVQLWVNLPAKDKMRHPKYQAIGASQMGVYTLPDDAGAVAVVAGSYKGVKGPATTFSPVHLMNAGLHQGGKASFTFPENYTTAMVVIDGEIRVNNEKDVPVNHFVLMNNDGEDFFIEAKKEALVLVLSGEPIGESIAAHGPFVMNTRNELIQAFEDFNAGKFGNLE